MLVATHDPASVLGRHAGWSRPASSAGTWSGPLRMTRQDTSRYRPRRQGGVAYYRPPLVGPVDGNAGCLGRSASPDGRVRPDEVVVDEEPDDEPRTGALDAAPRPLSGAERPVEPILGVVVALFIVDGRLVDVYAVLVQGVLAANTARWACTYEASLSLTSSARTLPALSRAAASRAVALWPSLRPAISNTRQKRVAWSVTENRQERRPAAPNTSSAQNHSPVKIPRACRPDHPTESRDPDTLQKVDLIVTCRLSEVLYILKQ